MIYPKVSLKEWLRRYPELEIQKGVCDACGREMETVIPFLEKDYAGLIAPPCICTKNRHTCMSTVTRTDEEFESWKVVLSHL